MNFTNRPLFQPISSGSLFIPGNLFLAPLAGFTDRAFRDVCIDFGAVCTFTEMVSAEGVTRGNSKTITLMRPAEKEIRYGIQLFTADPLTAYKAALKALDYNPILIDINCGCPVPKVTKTGAGAALMKNPPLIGDIVSAVLDAIQKKGGTGSVSVKLRSGWDNETITFREAASEAVAAGAALVSLHPRTKQQGYAGTARWDFIRELKQMFPSVPVIGSGDLLCPEDGKRMLTATKCDGIMFARGAVGNPFIFARTKELLLYSRHKDPPSARERLETAVRHLRRALYYYDKESTAVKEMKKQFCAYTKGLPGGAALRKLIVHAQTAEDYTSIIDEYISDIDFTEG